MNYLDKPLQSNMPQIIGNVDGINLKKKNFRPGQSKDDIGPIYTMISGAIGGVCLWTAIFPADVIKSRIQVSGSTKGMIAVGVDIFKTEGGFALYNGLTPTVLRTIPATAVLFLVYEYTKKFLEKNFIV